MSFMTIWDTLLRIKNLGLWLSVPSLPSYVVVAGRAENSGGSPGNPSEGALERKQGLFRF